jgi:excisionase family DNA binding protein
MPAPETDLFAGRVGLSVDEVACAFGCHRATIYHWLSQGLLISSVIGKRRFIHRDSIVKLLLQNIEPTEASRPRTIGVKPTEPNRSDIRGGSAPNRRSRRKA